MAEKAIEIWSKTKPTGVPKMSTTSFMPQQRPIMIQSAVEELYASGPAHTGFFSTLFCVVLLLSRHLLLSKEGM